MSATKRETTEVAVSANNIILDIEGTTTSISFVKDVLFPYVRKHVADFLKENLDSDNIKPIVNALRSQAKEDEESKVEGVVAIPESDDADALAKAVVDNVLWQMDNDRKTKGLKDLQGAIYEEGYKKGDLKGHIYEDVEPCLKAWTEEGKSVYIYSSGSVQAQKLLYGHSEKGDLLTYIKGHFDTTVGMKGESQSYKKILEEISCSASEAVFLTDVPKEARAAKEAGIQALLVSRDGNAALVEEDKSEFQVITSFDEIKFEQNKKKRKLSSDNDVIAETDNKKVESCSEPVSETPEVPKVSDEEEKMEVDEVSEEKSTEVKNTEESKDSEVVAKEDKKEVVETAKSDEAVISSSDDSKPAKEETTEVSKPKEDDSATDSADSQKEVTGTDSEKVQSTEESVTKEENKETSTPDSTEDKVPGTEPATGTEKIADSTEKIEEKTESTEKKTEPEESIASEAKEVAVEETKKTTTETEKVPEEVSNKKVEVPKEDAVKEESKVDSKEETKVAAEKDDAKPSEEKESKSEETVEEKKEVVAVNGEAKTNGAKHDDKTPNGDLTNGAASPSEKSNGTHEEANETGGKESENTGKAGKLATSDSITLEPVIES